MKTIEEVNALFENRDQNDMLISTEILIRERFANLRMHLLPSQRDKLSHEDECVIVSHQLELLLNINSLRAQGLVEEYLESWRFMPADPIFDELPTNENGLMSRGFTLRHKHTENK